VISFNAYSTDLSEERDATQISSVQKFMRSFNRDSLQIKELQDLTRVIKVRPVVKTCLSEGWKSYYLLARDVVGHAAKSVIKSPDYPNSDNLFRLVEDLDPVWRTFNSMIEQRTEYLFLTGVL
tara:strand:+ start:433 stop:801 length:369 start_codon:yes stop_codon:yes gene_type:complete